MLNFSTDLCLMSVPGRGEPSHLLLRQAHRYGLDVLPDLVRRAAPDDRDDRRVALRESGNHDVVRRGSHLVGDLTQDPEAGVRVWSLEGRHDLIERGVPIVAWYQLSKGEQEELWAQVEDVERRAGSKWLILCGP